NGADFATSNAFQVKPGGSTLYFSFTFVTTAAGGRLGTITVQDLSASGAVDADDNTTQVLLTINNNPGGAQFVDATSGNPVPNRLSTMINGVATFRGVGLDKAGLGYTLMAQSTNDPTLTPAISNSFAIVPGDPVGATFMTQPTYTGTTDTINVYP